MIEATYDRFVASNALALASPAGMIVRAARFLVPDVLRRFRTASLAYNSELTKHVGSRYSRERILELQDDSGFTATRCQLREAVYALAAQYSWLFAIPIPPKRLLPRPLRRDHEMLTKASRMLTILNEVRSFANERGIGNERDEWDMIPNLRAATPRQERFPATPWFVDDPGVPVEIAKRYMEAYVAQTTMDLAQRAAPLWPVDDLKRAVIDWASTYEHALVFIASLPSAHIPSLAGHEQMDVAAIVSRHNERRALLASMAADASRRIKNAQ